MQRISAPQSRQRGLSMIGFLFGAAIVVAIAMVAMKLVPAYIEFFSVKKILVSMGQEPELRTKSNAEIREDFTRRASAGYVTVVKAEDLSIERDSGAPVISVAYEYRTTLVANVSLVVDFNATSSQIE